MAQWYYTQNGQQAGPVDDAQLKGLLASGQVGASDMVWKDGMAAWQPASSVPELSAGVPAAGPAYGAAPYGQAPYAQPQYGQPQYGQPVGYAQGGYQPAATGADHFGKALTCFILSICGFFCFGVILGIVSIVLAVSAMNAMKASGNPRGKGLAMAGLIIGIIDIPTGILGAIIFMSSQHRSF